MRIRLLAFASASDALGASEVVVEVPHRSSVGTLKSSLEQRYPALSGLWPRIAIAVDGEIADDEALLEDDAEVALLPPVSGGSTVVSTAKARLVDGPIDTSELVRSVQSASRGAVVLFVGTVRDHHRGRPVERITYSAYGSMALSRLERIVRELEQEVEGLAVAVVHRLGRIEAGEPSVAIATASPHRQEAYAASRRALERLKAEVPIWKREHYGNGEAAWREEESLTGLP